MNRICGLWKNKTKTGETYLNGRFLGVKILILPNKDREAGKNHPDYILFLDEFDKKEHPEDDLQVKEEEIL